MNELADILSSARDGISGLVAGARRLRAPLRSGPVFDGSPS
jgi:hypothetical protein